MDHSQHQLEHNLASLFLKLQHLSDMAVQEVIQQLNQLVLLSRKISTFSDIIESLLITEMIHSFNLH